MPYFVMKKEHIDDNVFCLIRKITRKRNIKLPVPERVHDSQLKGGEEWRRGFRLGWVGLGGK